MEKGELEKGSDLQEMVANTTHHNTTLQHITKLVESGELTQVSDTVTLLQAQQGILVAIAYLEANPDVTGEYDYVSVLLDLLQLMIVNPQYTVVHVEQNAVDEVVPSIDDVSHTVVLSTHRHDSSVGESASFEQYQQLIHGDTQLIQSDIQLMHGDIQLIHSDTHHNNEPDVDNYQNDDILLDRQSEGTGDVDREDCDTMMKVPADDTGIQDMKPGVIQTTESHCDEASNIKSEKCTCLRADPVPEKPEEYPVSLVSQSLKEEHNVHQLEDNQLTQQIKDNLVTQQLNNNPVAQLEDNQVSQQLEDNQITQQLKDNPVTQQLEDNTNIQLVRENIQVIVEKPETSEEAGDISVSANIETNYDEKDKHNIDTGSQDKIQDTVPVSNLQRDKPSLLNISPNSDESAVLRGKLTNPADTDRKIIVKIDNVPHQVILVRDIECEVCHRNFSSAAFLKRHVLTQHKHTQIGLQVIGVKEFHHDAKCGYQCAICDVKFEKCVDRRQHMRRIHGHLDCRCPVCNKVFQEEQSLISHQICHAEGFYQCDQCSNNFIKLNDFASHVKCQSDQSKRNPKTAIHVKCQSDQSKRNPKTKKTHTEEDELKPKKKKVPTATLR